MDRTETDTELDLRGQPFTAWLAPVLRAAHHLADGARLGVRTTDLSWPLLAALQANGHTYRVTRREPGETGLTVWRRYAPEEARRYLRDPVRQDPPLLKRYARDGAGRRG